MEDADAVNRLPGARPATCPALTGLVALAGVCALAVTVARPLTAQESAGGEERDTAAVQVYLDDTARRLMEGARAARDSALADIQSYTAVVRERGSFEASVLVRDRPVVRFESATRVRWSRDGPLVLRVLGSRMGIGGQRFKPTLPAGVGARFAADPLRDPFSLFVVSEMGADADKSWFVPSVTPLDEDAERFYQFHSGDTISVGFSGGSVQAVSVTARPRFRNLGLVFAVMWIEPETFGVVRTIYRPAKPMDSEWSFSGTGDSPWDIEFLVQSEGLGDEVAPSPPRPGLLRRVFDYGFNALYPRTEFSWPSAVVDYALWNFRYWLPRRASFASFAVAGDEVDAEYSEIVTVQGFHDWDFEIEEVSAGDGDLAESAPTAEELTDAWREEGDTVEIKDESEPDSGTVVIMPRDWRALAASDLLPPSIWEERESGIYAGELDEAAEILDSVGFAGLPADPEGAGAEQGISPWSFDPPILAPNLIRYNAVEGVSVGTRLLRDFSWGRGALTVRTATRRAEPNVDLTVEQDRSGARVRFSLYHTLRQTGGITGRRPQRLELGADSSWYYVARGAAIQLLPARHERFWTSLRLFAESTTTLTGDAGRRAGVDVYWRPWWGGLTGRRVNGGADVSLQGLVGDFPSVRLSVMGSLVIPLSTSLSTALEAGGAYIWGDPAPREIWRLGGSGDWLRGYPRVVLRGREVWRSRVELQRKVSLVALSVFLDWASVDGRSLQSAGVGLSVFNGWLRADLARPLSAWHEAGVDLPHAPGWEVHLRAFAPF